MPKRLQKEESTATPTYAKFVADPFETGYGHTVGNSLRRVLLSSLEGAAITSLKVDGAQHEFATIDGVTEDVTDIVLNLKKVKFKAHTRDEQVDHRHLHGQRAQPGCGRLRGGRGSRQGHGGGWHRGRLYRSRGWSSRGRCGCYVIYSGSFGTWVSSGFAPAATPTLGAGIPRILRSLSIPYRWRGINENGRHLTPPWRVR